MRRKLAFVLFATALGTGPVAAQVGLKKPSDIVHAFVQDGFPCPGHPSSTDAFSHRILPTGEIVPLVVPAKKVMIVRHVEIATGGGSSNEAGLVTILAGAGTTYVGYATRAMTLDASGVGRLEIELPIGFPVPAGGSVCISNTLGQEFGGTLEGYFAAAK
jgi:hypothetical protein